MIGFVTVAENVVKDYFTKDTTVSWCDIRSIIEQEYYTRLNPAVWGGIARTLIKDGLIEDTFERVPSVNPKARKRKVKVYRVI